MLSIKQATYDTMNTLFPDMQAHNPDCSSITEEELKLTILASWPLVDGKIVIPFGFSQKPLYVKPFSWLLLDEVMAKGDIDYGDNSEELVHEFVRVQLNKWSALSNGTLFFKEEHLSYFSKGIFFYPANKNYTQEKRIFGTTYLYSDFQGYINQAFIYYATAISKEDLFRTIGHEIQHALGMALHLHEVPSIKEKLENIVDGVYCSISPYYQEITRYGINTCNVNCNPLKAITATALDAKILGLIIKDKAAYGSDLGNFDLRYRSNVVDYILLLYALSMLHNTIYTLVNLEAIKDKPFLSKSKAALLADAVIAASLLALEFPSPAILSFCITASARYLFPAIKNVVPERLNRAINNGSFTLDILNIALALSDEDRLSMPQLSAIVFGWWAIVIGSITLIPSSLINSSLQAVTSFISPLVTASENQHSLFAAKRKSLCQKIGNFFGYKEPEINADEDESAELLGISITPGSRAC